MQKNNSDKIEAIEFDQLPKSLEFAQIEKKWGLFWDENQTYRFKGEDSKAEVYAVDTPPPTVSGSLHVGHIFSYTQTDILARFQRMRGKNVFYPMGWDDNGLPTERRVQNYFHVRCDANVLFEPGLEIKPILEVMSDKEIQEKKVPQKVLSRKNFIELCHRLTIEDEKVFKKLWTHMGLSIDWTQEYSTIDDMSRKTAQLSFLDLIQKKSVYQVEAPTVWDTDFQTAIAQAELEDRVVPGAFHEIRFSIENSSDTFVIATTRPELLPACVGIAAHPDDERFKKWIGKRAVTPLFHVSVPIFSSKEVDPEKGTGILMVCTFGDQKDVQWWREQGLPLRQLLGRDGRLVQVTFGTLGWESLQPEIANENYACLVGKTVKGAQKAILEFLPLEKPPQPIQHAVKFYEKGDKPVEILTTRQWFVRLMDKKDDLLKQGEKIKWHPEFMKARYLNWTENLQMDWCISRQRYFGVSFPVWYSVATNGAVDYGKPFFPAPEQLPIDPMSDVPTGFTEKQRGVPGGFVGEPDVFDTWFTSSLTPQLGSHWGRDSGRHEKLFPMDVRPQSHEIIRTWAFYTIAKAYLHEKKIPWKNVVISGWVLDPDRKKMSKSKGNVVTPANYIDEFGADAVRYWSGLARYGVDTAFDPQVIKIGKRLVTKIFNASKFVFAHGADTGPVTEVLDQAFLLKLSELVQSCTQSFENFEPAQALAELERFFWTHFTDTYLELVKTRARGESLKGKSGQTSSVMALRKGLQVILRLFAPFLPYVTEEVWSWSFAKEWNVISIHQALWPQSESVLEEIPTVDARVFDFAIHTLSVIHQKKTASQVSVARPVEQIEFRIHPETFQILGSALTDVLETAKIKEFKIIEEQSFDLGRVEIGNIVYGPEPEKRERRA